MEGKRNNNRFADVVEGIREAHRGGERYVQADTPEDGCNQERAWTKPCFHEEKHGAAQEEKDRKYDCRPRLNKPAIVNLGDRCTAVYIGTREIREEDTQARPSAKLIS